MKEQNNNTAVRLDKWLWAARFYRTRNLAKQAIEGGKVQYNGARCKVSKEVGLGAELKIRCGWDDKIVEVLALSDQRRGATEAATLYQETAHSIADRERRASERKALGPRTSLLYPDKPNKKQRRQIHRFKQQQDSSEI